MWEEEPAGSAMASGHAEPEAVERKRTPHQRLCETSGARTVPTAVCLVFFLLV